MATAVDIGTLIAQTPGYVGGRARIAGTRMPVQVIGVYHEYHGHTPEKIHEGYPHLTMPQIYAALAYYYANRAEIQEGIDADEAACRSLSRPASTT